MDPDAFAREQALLDQHLAGPSRLIYFSSCALINDPTLDTPYLAHKRRMEERVLEASHDHLVMRLPQVVGPTGNLNTLTKFLYHHISNGITFTVWARAERNLIDVDDVAAIALHLLDDHNSPPLCNIAAETSLPMSKIVAIFERVLKRRADCHVEDRGDPLRLDVQVALAAACRLGIDLGEGYAERVIRKYYAET